MSLARPLLLVSAGLVSVAVSLPAQGDKVQGTLAVGATKVTLASGGAVAYTAPNGKLISVLLSDKPADAKAFAEDTKIGAGESLVSGIVLGAWKAQHFAKKLSGVEFTIGPNGIMDEEILVGGRNETFSLGSEYALDLKSSSPRLVGTIKTKAPVDLGGGKTVALDATFDLAVVTR